MGKTATISNYEAEAIMEALSFFIHKHGPEHAMADAMQEAFRIFRDGRITTINITED